MLAPVSSVRWARVCSLGRGYVGDMNRLKDATSPYLLQHADNPVDWWEWEPAAFEEARRRDVPVLLSVGYSACHWCHDPDEFFTVGGF